MKIGVMSRLLDDDKLTLELLLQDIVDSERDGLSFYALPNAFHVEAVTTAALAGGKTRTIELMTGVIPIQPRHPHLLAQQALTAQLACGGRFTLGVGLSHAVMMTDMLGLSYAHPAQQMREYLEVLVPLLKLDKVKTTGEFYRANAGLRIPGAKSVDVLVAALGPLMLRVAGTLAGGTFTWMTGARTLGEMTVPQLSQAAAEAGRGLPRAVAGLPIALVGDVAHARQVAANKFAFYGRLPSYRSMLDREGANGPEDVVILGDETALRAKITELRDAGVTDFAALPFEAEPGARARTLELLRTV